MSVRLPDDICQELVDAPYSGHLARDMLLAMLTSKLQPNMAVQDVYTDGDTDRVLMLIEYNGTRFRVTVSSHGHTPTCNLPELLV